MVQPRRYGAPPGCQAPRIKAGSFLISHKNSSYTFVFHESGPTSTGCPRYSARFWKSARAFNLQDPYRVPEPSVRIVERCESIKGSQIARNAVQHGYRVHNEFYLLAPILNSSRSTFRHQSPSTGNLPPLRRSTPNDNFDPRTTTSNSHSMF